MERWGFIIYRWHTRWIPVKNSAPNIGKRTLATGLLNLLTIRRGLSIADGSGMSSMVIDLSITKGDWRTLKVLDGACRNSMDNGIHTTTLLFYHMDVCGRQLITVRSTTSYSSKIRDPGHMYIYNVVSCTFMFLFFHFFLLFFFFSFMMPLQ